MLGAGDRVRISGGYDAEPSWLGGRESCTGKVLRLLPGPPEGQLLVELDEPLNAEGLVATFAVLNLRYQGAAWSHRQVVHVVLCATEPRAPTWRNQPDAKWVESHATCERVSGT